jgi:hypothetical protein
MLLRTPDDEVKQQIEDETHYGRQQSKKRRGQAPLHHHVVLRHPKHAVMPPCSLLHPLLSSSAGPVRVLQRQCLPVRRVQQPPRAPDDDAIVAAEILYGQMCYRVVDNRDIMTLPQLLNVQTMYRALLPAGAPAPILPPIDPRPYKKQRQ